MSPLLFGFVLDLLLLWALVFALALLLLWALVLQLLWLDWIGAAVPQVSEQLRPLRVSDLLHIPLGEVWQNLIYALALDRI